MTERSRMISETDLSGRAGGGPGFGHAIAFALALAVAGCATAGTGASGEIGALSAGSSETRAGSRPRQVESSFALIGLPCRSAGTTLESWVRSHSAVSRARFDSASITLSVVHDSRLLAPADLEALIESRGVHAIENGERGAIRPPVVFPSELDVASLPEAFEDDVEDHLVRGKVTVFHLRAPSGEVCSDFELALVVLMQSRDDIALRRLVSTGVPQVIVYAATAHRYGPFSEDDLESIEKAILDAAGGERIRLEP